MREAWIVRGSGKMSYPFEARKVGMRGQVLLYSMENESQCPGMLHCWQTNRWRKVAILGIRVPAHFVAVSGNGCVFKSQKDVIGSS